MKRYYKGFICFNILKFNILFKTFFVEVQFKCINFLFNHSWSRLNQHVDLIDCPSKLSKSFLRVVTTGSSVSSKILLPFSTFFLGVTFSFVTTLFLINGVTYFPSTITWWIFPWPFPENLLTPDTGQAPNVLVKIQSASCQ